MNSLVDELNSWLLPMFDGSLNLKINLDQIPALAPKREKLWDRIAQATFISDEEKRELLLKRFLD